MNSDINEEINLNPSVVIKKIKFNDNTEIELSNDDIVVFVGANNVGKSRALKDIKNDILESSSKKVIVDEIEYQDTNFEEINMMNYFKNNFELGPNGYDIAVDVNYTYNYNEHNFQNVKSGDKHFYKVLFSFLSTESRLNMTAPISYSFIKDKLSFGIMRKLERDKKSITKLNDILFSCFGKKIDISEGLWQGAVSKLYKFGTKDEIDKSVSADTREARCLLEVLENLDDQGDGIRSAVAILASLITTTHSLYLIDEPETFLHPPQARILGRNIVDLSQNKQCFISTHNIDLLRGMLEKDYARIKIIKINRTDNVNEFHVLDNDSIKVISNDKNLKYSNILNGLFYNTVVLCENESDCKFYSALLEKIDSDCYQNTLFCAVGGKDQFKIIIPLLNKLKINFLVIADLDLINNRDKLKDLINSIEDNKYNQISSIHNDFLNMFESGADNQVKKQSVIKEEILSFITDAPYMSDETASKIRQVLKNISHLKLLKNCGKSCLPAGECVQKYNQIIYFLNESNIFVVECGEIERFITEIDGHGSLWVEEVFKKYPTLDEPEYSNAKEFIKKVFRIGMLEEGENNE
jgi:putative ATPase